MTSNCPFARVFEDKFDYFSCFIEMLEHSRGMPDGKHAYCFVEEDFVPKLGFDLSNVPTIKVIECGSNFDPASIPYGDDVPFVIYAIQHSSIGLPVVKHLIENNIKFVTAGGYAVGGYAYDDKVARHVIEKAYIDQTIFRYAKMKDPGSREDFANLCQALYYTNHLAGDVVEVGCFQGSSGGVILDYANEKRLSPKVFYFFDVFDGFNYPEALNSADTYWANTHETEGLEGIADRLKAKTGRNKVNVEKLNIITDKLPASLTQISLCNIDVDLYEAVHAALFRLAPLMVTGGIMICEDAGHTPLLIGARLALEEFIQSEDGKKFTPVHQASGQVFLVKHQ